MNESKTILKINTWLMPLIAVALLLLIIAWMAGAFRDKIEPGLALLEPDSGESAVAVVRSDIPVTEPVPAGIGARQATTISSRTLARITHITVRAGDAVSKGQLLIELERSDLESRLQQASEQVRVVTARHKESRQSLDRAEQLYTQDLVAAAVLDEARANYDALTAELATARQAVKEAEVALSFTEIRAPIDGRVVERFAEPGDTASPGEKLLALYNPTSMRIEELVPAADPGSRSLMVKAQIDYDGQLLPGMYARMLVPAGTESLLLIPKDRVVDYGQLNIVWVTAGGQVDRRFVRTGRDVQPGMLEVISGLEENERIIPPRSR
jgi:multidrug efflux pump subunit AcrA (membrane-fusion protein)